MDKRLRLLMTADTIGGVWDYSLELAGQLSHYGVGTVLATMGRLPTSDQRRAAAAVPGLILQESDFKLEWMPDAGDDPDRAGEWLLLLERRYAPDIIHLNGYFHIPLPWRAPVLAVAHSCVLSWWQAVRGDLLPPNWRPYADRVGTGLRQAAAVVAPTAALLRTLEGIYGDLPQAETIWNGRDPGKYTAAEKGKFIFCAGRLWDEAKNLETLAAVSSEVEWTVIAAGDWRHPDGTVSRPDGVECLGILSSGQMAAWLARAPIYALPARYEPFGLSVLEAALSGCALVLGDIPTLRELWNGAALFIPPDDREGLRAALSGLIRDPRLRSALGRAAQERAGRYSADRMGKAYLRLYRQLLQKEPKRVGSPWPAASLAAKR